MRRDTTPIGRRFFPQVAGALTVAVVLFPLAASWVQARMVAHPAAIHSRHGGGFGYRGHGTVRHAANVHYRTQQVGQLQQNRIDAAQQLQDQRWDNVNQLAHEACGPYDHGDDNCWARYNEQWGPYYQEAAAAAPTAPAAPPSDDASDDGGTGGDAAPYTAPAVGTTVAEIPVDYQFVQVGDRTYDYWRGTFYLYASQGPRKGFTVVAPPVGAVVASVPAGASPREIQGKTYLVDGATYYRKVHSGSQVAYQVVADPGGS